MRGFGTAMARCVTNEVNSFKMQGRLTNLITFTYSSKYGRLNLVIQEKARTFFRVQRFARLPTIKLCVVLPTNIFMYII
jgi:hypothetical protein